eukprot:CAMPEP_0176367834 /NCGR_PEP_ID=MMETSP0126-20121128/22177_1 /TAXON_ID=141414 ORGANISM="Strombidinopsis acuminatum, Strain SPMC142" /NCGR_SAMPLE_ID=MMETSP0126 /ASSEMBLY_ACC=CAM_ASM_000229 /LENGTH=106 /DNA_ID=CAMNT_0017725853 /DNA_START=195 /DNA_END=515 /DNA_ORIENTATION=-
MDYSLLLAIEKLDPRTSIQVEQKEEEQNKYAFNSRNNELKYHISVIDFMQSWDTNKKLERFTKTKILGKSAKGLSAVPPKEYFTRFNNFMRNSVFPSDVTESIVTD